MTRIQAFQRDRGRAVRRPLEGDVLLAARDDGVLFSKNEWGTENYLQSDGLYTRPQTVLKNAGAATISSDGIVAPTMTATATNADIADGPFVDHATAATLNAASGVISAGFGYFRPGWYPRMRALIRTPAVMTNVRFLVGFFSGTPDALPGTLHGAWFRYDTGTDGTLFWRVSTAAGAAPTTTVTTSPIAASSIYQLGIDFVPPDPFVRGQVPPRVIFTLATAISEDVIAVHTATIPAANQNLGYGIRVTTLEAVVKNIQWSRLGFISP